MPLKPAQWKIPIDCVDQWAAGAPACGRTASWAAPSGPFCQWLTDGRARTHALEGSSCLLLPKSTQFFPHAKCTYFILAVFFLSANWNTLCRNMWTQGVVKIQKGNSKYPFPGTLHLGQRDLLSSLYPLCFLHMLFCRAPASPGNSKPLTGTPPASS